MVLACSINVGAKEDVEILHNIDIIPSAASHQRFRYGTELFERWGGWEAVGNTPIPVGMP